MNIETILRCAGNILKEEYLKLPDVSVKEKYDLVTKSDQKIEKKIIEKIVQLYPEDGIYSEEYGEIGCHNKNRWILDPIDGTADFIFGVPYFAISLAKETNGVITEGYVYNPIADEFYKAIKGEGIAYLNNQEITVSQTKEIADSLLAFGFSGIPSNIRKYLAEWSGLMAHCKKALPLITPALTICNVARGRIDGYIDCGSSMEGKAAASLILENAGGVIRNYDGLGFDYTIKGHICSNGFVTIGQWRQRNDS